MLHFLLFGPANPDCKPPIGDMFLCAIDWKSPTRDIILCSITVSVKRNDPIYIYIIRYMSSDGRPHPGRNPRASSARAASCGAPRRETRLELSCALKQGQNSFKGDDVGLTKGGFFGDDVGIAKGTMWGLCR